VRLSSYYQLGCDYGTAVMISWENGRIAPVYLCESHATQMGRSSENCEPQSVRSNHPPEGDVQAQAPVRDLTSGDSEKALVNEAIRNVAREDFEAYGTALQQGKPSAATEEKHAESANLERLCVSRYGERCTCEPTVHCPKCGRWFCDAHAEDEKWHPCALTT
jgi:hypothetical protein